MVKSLPMIAVTDVLSSSRWYQVLLGCKSGHGGTEYDQIVSGDQIVLQLHQINDDHPELGAPCGHPAGMALWFEVPDFDGAVKTVQQLDALVLHPVHLNQFANHREIWLQDPDGYRVVLASPFGDVVGTQPKAVT